MNRWAIFGRPSQDFSRLKHPAVLVNYRFTGFLDEIYATLVVRLHHTEPFQQDLLWRYAADFKTNTVKLTRRTPGASELEVYFDPAVAGKGVGRGFGVVFGLGNGQMEGGKKTIANLWRATIIAISDFRFPIWTG